MKQFLEILSDPNAESEELVSVKCTTGPCENYCRATKDNPLPLCPECVINDGILKSEFSGRLLSVLAKCQYQPQNYLGVEQFCKRLVPIDQIQQRCGFQVFCIDHQYLQKEEERLQIKEDRQIAKTWKQLDENVFSDRLKILPPVAIDRLKADWQEEININYEILQQKSKYIQDIQTAIENLKTKMKNTPDDRMAIKFADDVVYLMLGLKMAKNELVIQRNKLREMQVMPLNNIFLTRVGILQEQAKDPAVYGENELFMINKKIQPVLSFIQGSPVLTVVYQNNLVLSPSEQKSIQNWAPFPIPEVKFKSQRLGEYYGQGSLALGIFQGQSADMGAFPNAQRLALAPPQIEKNVSSPGMEFVKMANQALVPLIPKAPALKTEVKQDNVPLGEVREDEPQMQFDEPQMQFDEPAVPENIPEPAVPENRLEPINEQQDVDGMDRAEIVQDMHKLGLLFTQDSTKFKTNQDFIANPTKILFEGDAKFLQLNRLDCHLDALRGYNRYRLLERKNQRDYRIMDCYFKLYQILRQINNDAQTFVFQNPTQQQCIYFDVDRGKQLDEANRLNKLLDKWGAPSISIPEYWKLLIHYQATIRTIAKEQLFFNTKQGGIVQKYRDELLKGEMFTELYIQQVISLMKALRIGLFKLTSNKKNIITNVNGQPVSLQQQDIYYKNYELAFKKSLEDLACLEALGEFLTKHATVFKQKADIQEAVFLEWFEKQTLPTLQQLQKCRDANETSQSELMDQLYCRSFNPTLARGLLTENDVLADARVQVFPSLQLDQQVLQLAQQTFPAIKLPDQLTLKDSSKAETFIMVADDFGANSLENVNQPDFHQKLITQIQSRNPNVMFAPEARNRDQLLEHRTFCPALYKQDVKDQAKLGLQKYENPHISKDIARSKFKFAQEPKKFDPSKTYQIMKVELPKSNPQQK